ncbi:hypothetical protein DPMN_034257 [Dreissena polymorpha]|uniref:Uncharacterized protein n=1 Tax=Dreissena polymorpha TaxID=45954 RepID=A0A9D4RKR4_DREPO|nr:hypothetical protein DPMN_034257 [Dreissena polymorpha]
MARLSRLRTSTSISQLTHQLQALQVPPSPHPIGRLRDLSASRGHRTPDIGLCTQTSLKTAPGLLYGVQDQSFSPKHYLLLANVKRRNLAWFGHSNRHDCYPRQARWRSPSRPSEEKLN